MGRNCLGGLVALVLAPVLLGAANWPNFRGPSGQGMVQSSGLPLTWNESTNIAWKTPIHGKAWSSPVVWGNQVWVTTATEDGHELGVVRVNRETGKIELDQKIFDVAKPQYCIPFNSYGSPTPVIEEGRIYVTWGSPGTACLDTATGKILWQRRDFVCNHFRGAGSSLALWRDMLFLPFDGSDYQYIVALDKHDGHTIWKTDRSVDFGDIQPNGKPMGDGDFRKAFSTPRVAEFGGKTIVISEASKAVYAYDALTGKELWRVEDRAAHSGSATPVIGDNMIYCCMGHGAPELLAIRPGGSGVVNDSHVGWKQKMRIPTRSSPVLVNGLLYLVTDAGIVSCIDAKNGQVVFHGRVDGDFSASPLAAEGRVYFFSENGKTFVIEAGREFKVLAENPLADGIMACPAVADNSLFIRTRTSLYRIGKGG